MHNSLLNGPRHLNFYSFYVKLTHVILVRSTLRGSSQRKEIKFSYLSSVFIALCRPLSLMKAVMPKICKLFCFLLTKVAFFLFFSFCLCFKYISRSHCTLSIYYFIKLILKQGFILIQSTHFLSLSLSLSLCGKACPLKQATQEACVHFHFPRNL